METRNTAQFFDEADRLKAHRRALRRYQRGMPYVDVRFQKMVGEGYYAGGTVYAQTYAVRVMFDLEGGIVASFPLLLNPRQMR